MSAQDHLGTQFMSMRQMGTLQAGDVPGMTMSELANDDYARWEKDQTSDKYAGTDAMEDLTSSVEEHGVKEPIQVGNWGGMAGGSGPSVIDGHHRYLAAYDAGNQSRVPVTGRSSVVNHIARYTPPGGNR